MATFKTNFDLRLSYLQKEVESLRGELLKASTERYTVREARESWELFRSEWLRHLAQCEHCKERMEQRLLQLEKRK
jgi:hypothetical protein